MKKILLATFVIITFVIYSFHQRQDGSSAAVTAPVALNKTQSSSGSQPATSAGTSSTTAGTTYKNGQFTGIAADAVYGNIQVKATIEGGKLINVEFLQCPNDRRNSVEINSQAMPYLQQEAIQKQNAHVDGVSGATDTSQAFIQSLDSALQQAQA